MVGQESRPSMEWKLKTIIEFKVLMWPKYAKKVFHFAEVGKIVSTA